MKHLIIKIFFILCIIGFSTSCSVGDEPITEANRTILIYMVATNDLSTRAVDDIEEIESSLQTNGTNGGRLLVYWAAYNKAPQLIEITKGKRSANRILLKEYANDTTSTSPERMMNVVEDVVNLAPARDYGLILWSHSSGWVNSLSGIKPKTFGNDYGKEMPLDVLADALPEGLFNFIYADACYMACVEVAYELRNKTNYLIGSTTELPADGMDYMNNIPSFFEDNLNLEKICANTFNKYNSMSGQYKTCTISLTDLTKMDELASLCREIHLNENMINDFSNVQRYKYNTPYLFFDFVQYTKLLATDEQKEQLDELMNQIVLYKAATPYIFNLFKINPINYSGLSTYIIGTTATSGVNEVYYRTLSWYNDVIK